ncbi:hypothetical protein H311_02209 [Anncaliia algerae PRA109]|nr:hypothetical protein H311_02209 [Anncaliia algerae PRA109]
MILKSENSNYTLKILPSFNIIFMFKKCKIAASIMINMEYLLLVLCKIEVFRLEYFDLEKRPKETFEI